MFLTTLSLRFTCLKLSNAWLNFFKVPLRDRYSKDKSWFAQPASMNVIKSLYVVTGVVKYKDPKMPLLNGIVV